MPHPDYRYCKSCGGHKDDVGPLSWTRLCERCGKARMAENVDGLVDHAGDVFLRWRRGHAAGVGGVLVDDLRGESVG